MAKILLIFGLLIGLMSCASASRDKDKFKNSEEFLELAEANASAGGRRVLEASRIMISEQELHIGGCWNYINAVYERAGFPSKQRETVYKSKFNGPYVKSDVIQAGDWLYFVNHSFSESEHSAIFVTWIDEDKKEALMVNYVGGNKKKPGTYKRFILDEVYNVFRPQD
jgi:hypothetical protein